MSTQSILRHSRYNPSLGGHAPGDLRDAFFDAVFAYAAWMEGEPEPTVEFRERDLRISEVAGLLWNCCDTLPNSPNSAYRWLIWLMRDEVPEPRTYAAGARLLMRWIRDALASNAD